MLAFSFDLCYITDRGKCLSLYLVYNQIEDIGSSVFLFSEEIILSMLQSLRQNTIAFAQKATGIHMAAFCPCDKMYGRNIEGTSLSVELDPGRYRRSHCICIQ